MTKYKNEILISNNNGRFLSPPGPLYPPLYSFSPPHYCLFTGWLAFLHCFFSLRSFCFFNLDFFFQNFSFDIFLPFGWFGFPSFLWSIFRHLHLFQLWFSCLLMEDLGFVVIVQAWRRWNQHWRVHEGGEDEEDARKLLCNLLLHILLLIPFQFFSLSFLICELIEPFFLKIWVLCFSIFSDRVLCFFKLGL